MDREGRSCDSLVSLVFWAQRHSVILIYTHRYTLIRRILRTTLSWSSLATSASYIGLLDAIEAEIETIKWGNFEAVMLAMKVDTSLIGLYTGIGGRTTKLRLTRGCCCQLISRMHFQQSVLTVPFIPLLSWVVAAFYFQHGLQRPRRTRLHHCGSCRGCRGLAWSVFRLHSCWKFKPHNIVRLH